METYKILLDLLFENQRYEEVFKLYGEIRQHLEIYELMTDKTINCLVFGACYKLVSSLDSLLLLTYYIEMLCVLLCAIFRILPNTLNMHKIFGKTYNIYARLAEQSISLQDWQLSKINQSLH